MMEEFKVTKEQMKALMHCATNNVKDFVMNEDGFTNDCIKQLNILLVSGSYSVNDMEDAYDKGFKDAMVKYRE